ncbi:hypothetical protein [Methylobacterium gossipiicola]|uniref:Secreted protein n=1 Tax=Methylobacterium gossipiicola TaxID=582675 RepID=A0A1I2S5H3_9HYPH|nr:hypothetical protein [Methylobacterium gossipiicola]SFG48000.1 hypothetical protein SAMN05192565_10439 [Methylobacterium gossipiicola]
MRRSILACLVAFACGPTVAVPPSEAQESLAQSPLLLRIRPFGETPTDLGAGSGPRSDDEAREARARSEAVWARAERRSRIAIASVCTGCLSPVRPVADRQADSPGGAAPPAPPSPIPPSPIAQTGTP